VLFCCCRSGTFWGRLQQSDGDAQLHGAVNDVRIEDRGGGGGGGVDTV